MTVVHCPLFPEAFYKYTIDLSGETYALSFRWNGRCSQWMMDIETSEGEVVAKGVALVPVYPLTSQLSLEHPAGDFVLVPVDRTAPQITRPREIYKTHYLVYDSRLVRGS